MKGVKNTVASNLRVEEIAWEKLKIIAKENKRSINKEIEFLIEQAIKDYETKNGTINIFEE
ncbi:MAG: Arc family DNA-binding protein [Bacilli bacterium]|nr:Arc family DNA-binding protein [Bacilli bacterium]